jgi:hypothetical protein
MKNRALLNLKRLFLAVAICPCFFAITAKASYGGDTPWGDVDELRFREDAAVREVNEAALDEIEKIKAERRRRYIDEELGYVPDVNLISSDELASIEKQRKEKEMAIRARYGSDVNSLERIEASAMSDVAWKNQAAKPVKPVTLGTVTGIVLYNEHGAALVAGEIAREGDTVLGIKVVRITSDYVEFERRDKTWMQEVGEDPPAGVWEKPSPPAK